MGFLLWRLHEERTLALQTIEVDVFDNAVLKVGAKVIGTEHRDDFLSKWIVRPAAVTVLPPLSLQRSLSRPRARTFATASATDSSRR